MRLTEYTLVKPGHGVRQNVHSSLVLASAVVGLRQVGARTKSRLRSENNVNRSQQILLASELEETPYLMEVYPKLRSEFV